MAESNTWEKKENLMNAQEAIKEFKKEYWQDVKDVAKQKREEETFRKGKLPGRFTAKKLFGQSNKRYDQEYWGRLERNWKWQKGKQSGERKMETITEEEVEKEKSEVREWTEEDNNKMGNMVDPYYKL